MADYQAMYLKLFRSVTTAIEELEQAQRNCEELFVSSPENVLNFPMENESETSE